MRFKRYFGTDGIRGRVGQFPIVPEFILKLGWASGRVFSRYGVRKIILGKDTRVSSHMLESALEAGLSSSGISSMYTGSIPTPAVSYFTRVFRAVAGIVISASHNPFCDNGVKFFSIDGIKLSVDVERAIELELKSNDIHCVKSEEFGQSSWIIDAASRYIEFCKGTFPNHLDLKDLKIIVDCANGAAHNIAPNVLCELGANIICVGCQPNGLNINEECGATDIRRLRSIVLKEHANLGIAYDGDADRVIMVDHLGNKVDGDQILYIIARDRQRYSRLLGGVVGTQMSNIGLKLALKSLGIPFVRSYVGDRYVVNMMRKKGWYIGGENSGHIVLLDKTVTGDGIVVSLQVLLAMINNEISLYDLCQGIQLLPQVLFNIPFIYSKHLLSSNIVKETVRDVRKELGKMGRVLLRISGTEPCIRVMVEGEYYNQVYDLANKIVNVVQAINCMILISF